MPLFFIIVSFSTFLSKEQVIENAVKNEKAVQDIIKESITRIPEISSCRCQSALCGAIATSPDAIPVETRRKLSDILDKYH
ncbi:hypothetical protein CUJ83_10900 [Methanocella sp. CWC-04]|uniref:Uncharacterized protein n=1 Tax=Methanooceanicella nereidis TaxID=2052831 RepID=A0AAP2RE58_9EURY|nr:hypothetical protein [Methanocella sp. CWC-04]MCD1295507.1 hypothetical protein [Methanocella sp. CWC-04]